MRSILFSTALIAGVVWAGLVPAKAGPKPMLGVGDSNVQVAPVEKVGYRRRRYYRRYGYGYPAPYAYYPPAYGYYPPAYGYYPPRYPYYAPYGYRYYQPYYAPY
jgi:hypothetical protein